MRADLGVLLGLGACAASLALAGCVETPPPPPPRPYVEQQRPMPPPPPPPMREMGSITLYPGLDFRGPATPIDHAAADLPASGADFHVRSVQLAGGPWQLCSRPGFSGRCIVVTHSIHNLPRLGFDHVGSLRRAPR